MRIHILARCISITNLYDCSSCLSVFPTT
ncbi:unnamed protein product [Callosobruchus maculatus]|uniref:Uncharacterized protein n=1 Tax=Callosobruchus maculatus TaxID=64391 RepID=A0A653CD39_CALMS|nr:unnamed protein product [Callosobruchus maculatus]